MRNGISLYPPTQLTSYISRDRANENPGWGIEIDEKAAAKYPFGTCERGEPQQSNGGSGEMRRRDGSIIKQ